MMSLYLQEEPARDHCLRVEHEWLHSRLGGLDTLRSYGIDAPESHSAEDLHRLARSRVSDDHIEFLAGLETVFQTDDLFICHAGIQPGVPLADQVEDDLIWIRTPFHIDPTDHGKLIVHGRDRTEAIARLNRALGELIVDGVETTVPLFHALLQEPDLHSGDYNIHWLEHWLAENMA